MFYKKAFLKNLAIFIGKQLRWNLYLIKLEAQLFSCEYCEIFKNTYPEEYLRMAASEVSGEIAFALISHRKCSTGFQIRPCYL